MSAESLNNKEEIVLIILLEKYLTVVERSKGAYRMLLWFTKVLRDMLL